MKAEREPLSSHSSKIVASACLGGRACRYDGQSRPDPEVQALAACGRAVLACPESLGGLPCPRDPSEITGGDGFDVLDGRARVLAKDGTDVTEAYLEGARAFLAKVQETGACEVILKAKSPSCGVSEIYDGTHQARLRPGMGVTAALLERSGVKVREK